MINRHCEVTFQRMSPPPKADPVLPLPPEADPPLAGAEKQSDALRHPEAAKRLKDLEVLRGACPEAPGSAQDDERRAQDDLRSDCFARQEAWQARNDGQSVFCLLVWLFFFLMVATPVFAETQKIRVGHFPNVTHASALIARATQHFESRLGEGVLIEWKTFHAGPEAIEALFAGAIDILYVGPSPAVNGYVRSHGDALRIVAGVASGGAGFVVRQGSGIENFEDIRGKRVATPQKGNTQDVALRHLMKEKGLASKDQGGDVEIFNLAGGEQITAFLKEQIDAIWTVEPWLTRLVTEANGKILFEEGELWPDGKYATTVLVVRKKFLDENPDLVQKWVDGHVEMTDWINENDTKAKRIFNEEFAREVGKALPPAYLERFFSRLSFTFEPMESQIKESAKRAYEIGYLGKSPVDLSGLYELSFLNQTLSRKEH